jgi:sec-independent protein translocase protein TatA
MGKIGPLEIILIVAILLLLFGGRKIPELMRGIGQGMKEFRKAARDDGSNDENQKTDGERK